jgi:transcriptional regulator with XRE-family HTH domain
METIGDRVRIWRRRRKLSQATLAGLAGISQGYLSQIEGGLRSIEKRSTTAALAKALQVTAADLLGQTSDPSDPVRVQASEAVADIRVALVELEAGEPSAPRRGRAELDAALNQMQLLRQDSSHLVLAPLLPGLLRDVAGTPQDLVQVAYTTSSCLRSLGYQDLARTAARVALDAAEDLEDPAWTGVAQFGYVLALPIEAAAIARRVGEKSLSALQAAAADPRARQMLGQIHLSAAFAAAVANRPDDATAHLQEAEREARSLGEPADGLGFNRSFFGPRNVRLWNSSIAAEQGEFGRVLELAGQTPVDDIPVANRRQSHYLDVGRALAHSGKHDKEAIVALAKAERAAPAPFRLNPVVRDTISAMIVRAKRRSVGEDLSAMASRLGVSPT